MNERGTAGTSAAKPVRVLHIVGAMYPGGMENFIMNLYEHIDRSKVQFDFAVHARKPGDYKDRIEAMGGRIFELPRLTRHPVQNLRALNRLVRDNGYAVVVRHTANALVTPQLLAARLGGALTVCHSHNETDPARMLHYAGRMLMRISADRRMACSQKAGEWMYGKLPFEVVRNAIDIDRFAYSEEGERRIRSQTGTAGAHIYGHIANFIASKNHMFLIDVFEQIAEKDPDAVLLCLGEGELRPAIEAKIASCRCRDRIILAGMRTDVADCMSAMDVLLFPSVFEGLPLTLIEAQAASLPCLVSDTVTENVVVTEGLVSFESIREPAGVWAGRAAELMEAGRKAEKKSIRRPQKESIAAAGYDISKVAAEYERFCLAAKDGKR